MGNHSTVELSQGLLAQGLKQMQNPELTELCHVAALVKTENVRLFELPSCF